MELTRGMLESAPVVEGVFAHFAGQADVAVVLPGIDAASSRRGRSVNADEVDTVSVVARGPCREGELLLFVDRPGVVQVERQTVVAVDVLRAVAANTGGRFISIAVSHGILFDKVARCNVQR